MENNTKRRDKHRLMTFVAVLIILALVLSIVVPIFAAPYASVTTAPAYYEISSNTDSSEEETQTEPIPEADAEKKSDTIEVKAEAGFDGVYMVNHHTPVNVTVYNNGEDFKGTVQVKVYSDPLSGIYSNYQQNIDLTAGGAGEYDFIIYSEIDTTYFNVRILDENGNVVSSVNPKVTALSAEQILTAVVTDSRSTGLDYLNNLTIGEDIYNRSGYKTNYVSFLDKDTFPENSQALSSFSAVIIDDFNSASFSDEQKDALAAWVENGGLLVIGTGLNAEKTLKGLDGILDYKLNGYDTASCFGGTADTAVLDITGAEVVDIQGGKDITECVSLGEGKIIVHTFDLGADPIASYSTGAQYLSEFYRNTMIDKFGVDRNTYYYQDTINSINRLPSIEKDSLMMLMAVLGLYVIVVGPICYIVLKKKDKREKGWIAIPVIALVFSGVIFGISATSYQKDSLISFMTFTDLDLNSSKTQIATGIRTPEKGTVTFGINEDIILSNSMDYYYRYDTTGISKCRYTITNSDTDTKITYYDQNSWQSNTFVTDYKSNCDSNAIEGDFRVEGSSIKGTVTNNMDVDMVDVIATFAGQSIRVGYIPAGESLDVNIPLSSEEYSKWMSDSYQMLRQLFYGLDENQYNDSYVFRTGVSSTEAYKLEQRYNLFNNTSGNRGDLRNGDFKVKIAAFTENAIIEGEKTINGKAVNENWENMYLKTFDISLSDSFDIPFGYIFPDRIYLDDVEQPNNIDIYYYELYTMSASNILCEYDLSDSGLIKEIAFNWENYDAFLNDPQIYRWTDDTWVNISEADLTNNVSDYISENGNLKITADIYSDTYLTLPKMSIKGGN